MCLAYDSNSSLSWRFGQVPLNRRSSAALPTATHLRCERRPQLIYSENKNKKREEKKKKAILSLAPGQRTLTYTKLQLEVLEKIDTREKRIKTLHY